MNRWYSSGGIFFAQASAFANFLKRQLPTQALLAGAMVGSAQGGTVLERVLAYADRIEFNTTLANISETTSTYTPGNSLTYGIDGSITNLIRNEGLPSARFDILAAELVHGLPTIDIKNIDALGIGAVNTGGILLEQRSEKIAEILAGTNAQLQQVVTETTKATHHHASPLGATADTSTLVLNMASSSEVVQARVENVLYHLSGTIAQITTTSIGAVNTSRIENGLNATIKNIVGPSL